MFPDLLRNCSLLSPVWWVVAPIPPRNPLTPKLRVGGDTHSHRVDIHPMASSGQGSDVLSWIPVPQLPWAAQNRSFTAQLMGPGPVPLLQLDETSQVETVSEENKNLMWVLLRQLRPGMDLSRVVLPTFVLEPRSFLSKLSDYYYHGDLLSRCTSRRRGAHTSMDLGGRGWGGARKREIKA